MQVVVVGVKRIMNLVVVVVEVVDWEIIMTRFNNSNHHNHNNKNNM